MPHTAEEMADLNRPLLLKSGDLFVAGVNGDVRVLGEVLEVGPSRIKAFVINGAYGTTFHRDGRVDDPKMPTDLDFRIVCTSQPPEDLGRSDYNSIIEWYREHLK